MKKIVFWAAGCFIAAHALCQGTTDGIRTEGLPVFPKIVNSRVPGAPVLGQPILITGTLQEIRTEKHGLAYPALYDWNHDGKADLLVGEFETGQIGSYIKVYLNTGTRRKPVYTGRGFYATDINTDTITNYQWCCIGIHPRFSDIDGDGYTDMLSGQYFPGLITCWRGGRLGFHPPEYIPQAAYHEAARMDVSNTDTEDTTSYNYWTYTSAGFADFNGDGLTDLFVGGFGALRVALNEGTRQAPRFGLRKNLLGIDGLPLSVVKPAEHDGDPEGSKYGRPHYAGVEKSFITPVDWDGDGVLDLLVTHAYGSENAKDPVVFFRGVQTDKGLRFQNAVPLFTAVQAQKTFPGCQPNICVADYNNDGVMDLVIGLSLPTVNGYQVDSLVAWSYLHNLGIAFPGKDAGRAVDSHGGLNFFKQQIAANPQFQAHYLGKLGDEKYLTLRHRGYVYVMEGKKNAEKAIALKEVSASPEYIFSNEAVKSSTTQGPVTYMIKAPVSVAFTNSYTATVTLDIKDGWYAYAENAANNELGLIPTKVTFQLPDGFFSEGPVIMPPVQAKETYEIYKGNGIAFSQKFTVKRHDKNGKIILPGVYTIGVELQYQTCNEESCLPPVIEKQDMKVTLW